MPQTRTRVVDRAIKTSPASGSLRAVRGRLTLADDDDLPSESQQVRNVGGLGVARERLRPPLPEELKRTARDMDGTADAGAPRARQQNSAPGRLGPMTSALVLIGLALLLGTLSVLVMLPAAQHLRSFQDGERAPATLHTSGSCMLGRCQVTFEAGGRTVVADLPVGSGGGKSSVGTPMIVRYQADDPQVAVREDDVGAAGQPRWRRSRAGQPCSPWSCRSSHFVVRQRLADPMLGRTPQGG